MYKWSNSPNEKLFSLNFITILFIVAINFLLPNDSVINDPNLFLLELLYNLISNITFILSIHPL